MQSLLKPHNKQFLINLIFRNFKKSINIPTGLGKPCEMRMSSKECCRIDAIVTVDAKGQIVLPKDMREKANLKPNDKLAVMGLERNGTVCCFVLVKTEALGGTVKNMLGPIFKEAFNER